MDSQETGNLQSGGIVTVTNDPETCDMIMRRGKAMVKKPNPVYMVELLQECEVETNEGVMHGNVGDYLCHDPLSGHIWPVAADYVAMHYESAPEQEGS